VLAGRATLWFGCAILAVAMLAAEDWAGGSARNSQAASVAPDFGGECASAEMIATVADPVQVEAAIPDSGSTETPAADDQIIIIDAESSSDKTRGPVLVVPAASEPKAARRATAKRDPKHLHRVYRVTAYADRGITAAGVPSGVGQCAAPAGIPFGSKVYIPELGRTFIVTDRTSERFRRNTVDVFIPSEARCRQFGRRYHRCEITLPDDPPAYGKVRTSARG
jgi:3D (Asp-Asp-Asp) domain-containing protein